MPVSLEEIFCYIDDFCKCFYENHAKTLLTSPLRKRIKPCKMSLSEVITIMILFHFSHYRTFKDFYLYSLSLHFTKEFPDRVSYHRFIERMSEAVLPMAVLLQCCSGEEPGKYYIDSTPLKVCHNLRISGHKVFKGIAARGKTSTGWFFGMKLHLLINDKGEIMNLSLTPGNTADVSQVKKLTTSLKGWLFGDKGYLSSPLCEDLRRQGLELFTKVRKGMKEKILSPLQRFYLSKRPLIETCIGKLKASCHIDHTRHRSSSNFLANLLSGLLAYTFTSKKPSIRPYAPLFSY